MQFWHPVKLKGGGRTMPAEFRRRIYARGSSFETTIPMPLLFKLDLSNKKYEAVFKYDSEKDKWYMEFAERSGGKDES